MSKKQIVQMQRQGTVGGLIFRWIMFFWFPLIPIIYWLKMKKTKTYEYNNEN